MGAEGQGQRAARLPQVQVAVLEHAAPTGEVSKQVRGTAARPRRYCPASGALVPIPPYGPAVAKCLFCSNQANSNEHLFPAWLNAEFPNPDSERRLVTRQVGDNVHEWFAWETAYLQIKAVCKTCNETWMSAIEGRTKPILLPMIYGQKVNLSMTDQLELATWATLKAMVYDSRAVPEPVTETDELATMRREQRPPATCRVSLAGQANPGLFSLRRRFVAGQHKVSEELHLAAATTFVLGHLVVQTLASPHTTHRTYTQVGTRKPQVQSILPPIQAGTIWPLPYLDDAMLIEFGDADVVGNIPPENQLNASTYPGRKAVQKPSTASGDPTNHPGQPPTPPSDLDGELIEPRQNHPERDLDMVGHLSPSSSCAGWLVFVQGAVVVQSLSKALFYDKFGGRGPVPRLSPSPTAQSRNDSESRSRAWRPAWAAMTVNMASPRSVRSTS